MKPKTNNLTIGTTRQLTITFEPEGTEAFVDWFSDDGLVASVDQGTGLVTAVGVGSTTIRAITGSGVTDEVTMNVTE